MRRIEVGTGEAKKPGGASWTKRQVAVTAGNGRVADMTGKTATG